MIFSLRESEVMFKKAKYMHLALHLLYPIDKGEEKHFFDINFRLSHK